MKHRFYAFGLVFVFILLLYIPVSAAAVRLTLNVRANSSEFHVFTAPEYGDYCFSISNTELPGLMLLFEEASDVTETSMKAATLRIVYEDFDKSQKKTEEWIKDRSDISEAEKARIIRDGESNVAYWKQQLDEALRISGGAEPEPIKFNNMNEIATVLERSKTYYLHIFTDREITGTTKVEKVPRSFQDVTIDDYFYEPVKWAADHNITNGTAPQKFSPNNYCTRAEVVTFLWRMQGSPNAAVPSKFVDVPSDTYFAKAVAWAVARGITTGTDNTHFSPDKICSRAEIVTFLSRTPNLKYGSIGRIPFADVPAGYYYHDAVCWAYDAGIARGVDETHFAPDAFCTRGQVVTFLHRAAG